MKKFQLIFDEFNEVIEGVQLLIEYYENKSTLKSTIYKCIDWKGSQPSDRKILEDKFIKVVFPQNVYFNSQYMILCASYESFLKSCLKQTLLSISGTRNSSKISHSLKNLNISYSGNLLSTLTGEKKTSVVFNPTQLIENLYLLENKDNSFSLNSEIADLVPSVLLFEKVLEFLNKCELKIDWVNITDDETFKDIYQGNKTERKNLAEKMHQDLYRNRNNIAHQGCGASVINGDLKDLIKFLKPFSKSLLNVVDKLIKDKYY